MRPTLVLLSLLLSACVASTPASNDVAAVLIQPSSQTQQEIQRAVSNALDGASVAIAPDALTRDSLISIERTAIRDGRGVLVNGRDPGRPEIFELRKQGKRCSLLHRGSDTRVTLRTARCAAL